jgi:DNA-binding XRE family transcriptional regulator
MRSIPTAYPAGGGPVAVVDGCSHLLYYYNMSPNTRKPEPRIHNRLAVLRAERGISRQQLADAVGVNVQTIGYLERGDYNPSLALAFAIASTFSLPIDAVFSPEPFPPMSEQLYGRTGHPEPPTRS